MSWDPFAGLVTWVITDCKFGLTKREVGDLLRSRGLNPTSQRVCIAHLMLQRAQHLSADEIFGRLNRDYEQVSQATVYNTLRLLVENGVVRELVFSTDRIYYDSNTSHHHHFIDQVTGEIVDIPADGVDFSFPDLDIHVENISLIIRGRLAGQSATALKG